MQVSPGATVGFSEKIPSENRVLNPLGIQYHLRFQNIFLPGITSVTKRVRYYTPRAWYYQYLYEEKIRTAKEFERLFILACLNHHDGDYGAQPLRRIHNSQRFKDDWEQHDQ